MLKRFSSLLFFIIISLVIISCANRGTPSGGDKDVDPPNITKEDPENFSTNFNTNEIRIYFDEYVKIKDLQKQLIISPPLNNTPTIYPLGGASKYITIKIKDTLLENTTYAFNFGQSIVDNNEENPFPYYRYVFSTGNSVDSLSVKGYIKDALKERPDNFVSVMLYEADSTYTDSIVYKEKPRYITNTLDSASTFSIENIKEGNYRLIALKDENSNYLFDQKYDKIAFLEREIEIPADTSSNFELLLFKEPTNFKAFKPKQGGASKIIFPYEGDYENMRIKLLNDTIKNHQYRITKDQKADTLYYWYKPKFKVDTTYFVVTNNKAIDTFKHRFRALDSDSLYVKKISGVTLGFEEDFVVEATTPLINIDETKISIMDKDSLDVPFKMAYDSIMNRINFAIKKEENQRYNFTILPETFEDFYNNKTADTLSYTFRTKLQSDYGNMRINIRNAKFPLIIQLVDESGEVMYEQYTTESPVIDFFNIFPKQYSLRAIFDTNENGKYDSGNFLLGIQPERVSYSPKIDQVRANFDQIIEFTLLD